MQTNGRDDYPETDSRIYDQLIFDAGARSVKRSKESLRNSWCWENWSATCRNMTLDLVLMPHTKVRSKLDQTRFLEGSPAQHSTWKCHGAAEPLGASGHTRILPGQMVPQLKEIHQESTCFGWLPPELAAQFELDIFRDLFLGWRVRRLEEWFGEAPGPRLFLRVSPTTPYHVVTSACVKSNFAKLINWVYSQLLQFGHWCWQVCTGEGVGIIKRWNWEHAMNNFAMVYIGGGKSSQVKRWWGNIECVEAKYELFSDGLAP